LRTSWFVVGMAAPLSLRRKGVYYKVTRRGPEVMLPMGVTNG
jgi:hypothetical protein